MCEQLNIFGSRYQAVLEIKQRKKKSITILWLVNTMILCAKKLNRSLPSAGYKGLLSPHPKAPEWGKARGGGFRRS